MHLILILFYSLLCTLSEVQAGEFDSSPLNTRYDDDEISSKIYGGENAKRTDFPNTVSLQIKNTSGYGHFCGGIILSKRVILTAAHCIKDKDISKVRVVAGITDLHDLYDAQIVTVNNHFVHPDHDSTTFSHDIGVLIVDPPLTYTRYVLPVTLPPHGREPDGKCMVSGWGLTKLDVDSIRPNRLQKVELTITERHQCPKSIEAVTGNNRSLFDFTMICSHEIDKGTRPGDSGGPMLCKDRHKNNYLAGVVSNGARLCNNPKCSGTVDFISVFSHVGYFYCYIRDYLLLYPESRTIGGNTSTLVKSHVKLSKKKICRSKSVNKTSHVSETKKRLDECYDLGKKCDQPRDCCKRICRLAIGRGKVCTFAENDEPESDPGHQNFSVETFLYNKFLRYQGWNGAAYWEYNTDKFVTLSGGYNVERNELPALRKNIFITDTCCAEDKYILESRKQKCLRIELAIVQLSLIRYYPLISYVFETYKGMYILITEGLHEEQDRLESWRIVNYWREDLASAGW